MGSCSACMGCRQVGEAPRVLTEHQPCMDPGDGGQMQHRHQLRSAQGLLGHAGQAGPSQAKSKKPANPLGYQPPFRVWMALLLANVRWYSAGKAHQVPASGLQDICYLLNWHVPLLACTKAAVTGPHTRGPKCQRGHGTDITSLAVVCATHWLQQRAAQPALIRQATAAALSKHVLQCVYVECWRLDVSTTRAGNRRPWHSAPAQGRQMPAVPMTPLTLPRCSPACPWRRCFRSQ